MSKTNQPDKMKNIVGISKVLAGYNGNFNKDF